MGAGVLAFVGGAEMNLTEWYPGDVKPVRPGVYQRDWGGGIPVFSKWTGSHWKVCCETVNQAAKERRISSFQFIDPWRGLAQDPKGSKK
jgi:hypothetical protein